MDTAMKRHRDTWLAIVVLSTTAGVPAFGQSKPDASSKIVAALQPFVESHALAGAVTLVADKDKVLAVDTVGFADVEAKSLMRPDTLFWIASQSKPITATALMILVDEGKVKLDDPIAKYLPEFLDQSVVVFKDKDTTLLKRASRPVTVRDILSHTSGMAFSSAMETPTLDGLSLRDAVRSYAMSPLQSEPGVKYQYSNEGINTAGRIIEVVSGMPFETFLDKRLLEPLGMKDTTFRPSEVQLARLAKPYKPNAGKDNLEPTTISQLTYPLSDRKRQPMPAGGLFSTADDISKFCRMLLNKGTFEGRRLVSESAVAEMTKKQTAESIKDGYGLGFSTGGGSFGHGGALATNMTIDTKRGLITVFLVQHAGFPKDGDKSQGEFRKAAEQVYGGSK